MSKISAMMDVGKRSLMNNQTALQTVGHNIANKSTEGFSRQRVEILSNGAVGEGNLRIGMGARAGVITRTNNPWLEKQIQREDTNQGYTEARSDAMARVEQVFNEQTDKGINQYMTDFFNSFRELSNNPESVASRTIVHESAQAMTEQFGKTVDHLRDVQEDIDGQLRSHVEEINQMAKEIAQLNEKVQLVEVQGIPANDERDRRDLLLKKLGEKIDITWAESPDGHVSVTAGRTGILVSATSYAELQAAHTDDRNRTEIFFKSSPTATPMNITDQIKGGRIGALLEVRDETVEGMINSVDKLAYGLAKEVNTAHIEGYDRYGKAGVLFFDMPEDEKGAAKSIAVNATISSDVGRIAAGAKTAAPGDNTVSNVIANIQNRRVMENGGATLDDYYSSQVGRVGTLAQRANKANETQKTVVSQLNNIRESISGVSLDEETTKMIEFQKAYEASARLIRTADEMLDTVLNLKRL